MFRFKFQSLEFYVCTEILKNDCEENDLIWVSISNFRSKF
ncbi:unnamed protein product [Arabidopsis halleri]